MIPVKKNILLTLFLIFIFSLPCLADDDLILPDGYGDVKLGDSLEKVTSTYDLLKIGLLGPFGTNLYVLQMTDPYIKEVDFEFSQDKLIWICIRFKSKTGDWNNPDIVGYGNFPFEVMEEKFIQEFGEPDDDEEGESKIGSMTSSIWKRWIWKNENTVMEFEGKCRFSGGMQGAYVYTQHLYPKELEEKLQEIREAEEDD